MESTCGNSHGLRSFGTGWWPGAASPDGLSLAGFRAARRRRSTLLLDTASLRLLKAQNRRCPRCGDLPGRHRADLNRAHLVPMPSRAAGFGLVGAEATAGRTRACQPSGFSAG